MSTLIDPDFGEQRAQAGANAWLQQLTLTSELPSLALNSKAREWVARAMLGREPGSRSPFVHLSA
jgi:hypothetical protein